MKRLAVLVSGNGTNMENLIREAQAGRIPAEVALVVCDRSGAAAIARAQGLGVEVVLIEGKKFSSKQAFEAALLAQLEEKKIDWILLAGFMRILSPAFVRRWDKRILNIHPALLPAFPGVDAIRQAYEAKVKETGVTVHYVDEGIDTGPVILQRKVRVEAGETLESLEARIHALEYQLYPEAVRIVLGRGK